MIGYYKMRGRNIEDQHFIICLYSFNLNSNFGIIPKEKPRAMLHSNMKCFSSSTTLFFLSFVFAILCTSKAVIQIPRNETIPVVIMFGDSIVDTGTNNDITTIAKCNFLPYGRDFKGGIPTGRFSNGKVPSDFLGYYIRLSHTDTDS